MRDEPRSDARFGIQALKAAGITLMMLTGDNLCTATAIVKDLGIEAELLPEDNQRIVRALQARGMVVAKVGDGINDGPGWRRLMLGLRWAAAPTWRSKQPMQPCCTGECSTSHICSTCQTPPWRTSLRTSPLPWDSRRCSSYDHHRRDRPLACHSSRYGSDRSRNGECNALGPWTRDLTLRSGHLRAYCKPQTGEGRFPECRSSAFSFQGASHSSASAFSFHWVPPRFAELRRI